MGMERERSLGKARLHVSRCYNVAIHFEIARKRKRAFKLDIGGRELNLSIGANLNERIAFEVADL